jgi:membrane associated rhomboid family serine protease
MRPSWSASPPHDSGGLGGLAMPRPESVTKALLWANGIVFALLFVLLKALPHVGGFLYDVLSLQPSQWREWFPLVPFWQVLTYSFLHSPDDIFHLLFNLLALYFFGTMVEGIVGGRRFLTTYLIAAMLGGAVQLAIGLVQLASGAPAPPTYGASGAVMATLVAAAVMQPHARVIFIIFPLKLRTLALILVGVDVFRLLSSGPTMVAVPVHLTGAAWGFLAVWRRWIWIDPLEGWARRSRERAAAREQRDNERLDRLLVQIHDPNRGLSSLSERDKAFLKRVSARKR